LAMSLARHGAARTLLADLDLGAPRLARRLGLGAVPLSLADWLSSDAPARSHFIRVGSSLAVCLNTEAVPDSAELLQDARTARRLQEATAALDPTAVVYDLPPMLTTDDALGFLPQVDCVLLVVAAGQTTSE
ncbi:MAG TPA: exopolysaccharide biosynthesis protein, partial [Thermohalobaculum sp.]|nr:exopolysaccharide biosynthesis protein [Thermohalobaculum sp.]